MASRKRPLLVGSIRDINRHLRSVDGAGSPPPSPRRVKPKLAGTDALPAERSMHEAAKQPQDASPQPPSIFVKVEADAVKVEAAADSVSPPPAPHISLRSSGPTGSPPPLNGDAWLAKLETQLDDAANGALASGTPAARVITIGEVHLDDARRAGAAAAELEATCDAARAPSSSPRPNGICPGEALATTGRTVEPGPLAINVDAEPPATIKPVRTYILISNDGRRFVVDRDRMDRHCDFFRLSRSHPLARRSSFTTSVPADILQIVIDLLQRDTVVVPTFMHIQPMLDVYHAADRLHAADLVADMREHFGRRTSDGTAIWLYALKHNDRELQLATVHHAMTPEFDQAPHTFRESYGSGFDMVVLHIRLYVVCALLTRGSSLNVAVGEDGYIIALEDLVRRQQQDIDGLRAARRLERR